MGTESLVDDLWPALRISEIHGRVRLGLDGFGDVEGATLQDAGDELVAHLLHVAIALRAGGIGQVCSECSPDTAALNLIWTFGEMAATGRDPRELLFGPNPLAPQGSP